MIFRCQHSFVINIVLTYKGIVDSTCLCKVETSISAVGFSIRLTLKQVWSDDDGSVATSFSHFRLEFLGKVIITLAGDDCEDIGIKDVITQHISILSFTILVHAQTHTTTNLLTLLCLVVGVLQGAYLKNIWIIPTFLQCRVREDEAYWLFQRQQAFLVLHDKVKSTFLILALLVARVNGFPLLVHREIALVHSLCGISWVGEITQIGFVSEGRLQFRHHISVFFLKHLGKLAFGLRSLI